MANIIKTLSNKDQTQYFPSEVRIVNCAKWPSMIDIQLRATDTRRVLNCVVHTFIIVIVMLAPTITDVQLLVCWH